MPIPPTSLVHFSAVPEPDPHQHWTEGPARWAASIVLGAACLGGLGWSIFGRTIVDNRQAASAPAAMDRAELRAERGAEPAAAAAAEGPEVIDVVEDQAYAQRIDLNAAGSAELQLLPGIGPALADRIIEDRQTNGPYQSVDDLMRVKGIGPRTVARLRDMARAD